MSRTSCNSFVILAAVASIGFLAASATDASARAGGGHSIGMSRGGNHISMRSTGRIGGLRSIARVRHVGHYRPHWHWRYGWRRHYWVTPLVATGVATGVVATAPTWNRCSCLTKEYTPEGAVVFKDLCTKEIAMNPPALPSAAALEPGPAAPVASNSIPLQPLPQVR